ncbi:cytosine permease [Paraburkholderia sp. C35]|uniref:cytosine permease n=1 Tax=Paraburkholderia sp. C35 TaxID=2126993 RepID=UPI000D689AF2|nr:cytosine permease [Paraburkholderia sp. C35]
MPQIDRTHASEAISEGLSIRSTQLVSGFRITMVLLGVMIALPAFVMGASLSHALGVKGALTASLAGGLLLALVALPAAIAGARSRQTTYVLIQRAFGTRGGALVNLVIIIAVVGWFGVVAMMFGEAVRPTLPDFMADLPVRVLALAGCILMAAVTIVGFRALDLLSMIASPFKLLVLFWTLVAALRVTHIGSVLTVAPSGAFSMTTGIAMVAGGIMTGAILAPDLSRFAKTPAQAAVACGLAYGVLFPLVLMLSGLPAVATGEQDLVKLMLTLGLGIPAMVAVLLIAVTTNAYNLYAGSLIAATIAPRRPHWQLAIAICVIGALAGIAGISEKVTPFLVVLSVCIPPVGGVYLINFYLGDRFGKSNAPVAWHPEAFVAWLAGSGFAFAAGRLQIVITSIAPLDSLLISALVWLLLNWTTSRTRATRSAQNRGI